MNILDELERNQAPTGFYKTEEYYYYRDNASILSSIDLYSSLNSASTTFDVVRANILIKALENKRYIELEYISAIKGLGTSEEDNEKLKKILQESIEELPYLSFKGKKLFVPVFPFSLNRIYNTDFYRLGYDPYRRLVLNYEAAVIDPFDYYGQKIYLSSFTNLVPIMENDKSLACYHDEANAIYIINDEGRLDAKISLFDSEMKTIDKSNIIERIKPIAEAYLSFDKNGFLKALADSKCFSDTFIAKINKKEAKRKEKEVDK